MEYVFVLALGLILYLLLTSKPKGSRRRNDRIENDLPILVSFGPGPEQNSLLLLTAEYGQPHVDRVLLAPGIFHDRTALCTTLREDVIRLSEVTAIVHTRSYLGSGDSWRLRTRDHLYTIWPADRERVLPLLEPYFGTLDLEAELAWSARPGKLKDGFHFLDTDPIRAFEHLSQGLLAWPGRTLAELRASP